MTSSGRHWKRRVGSNGIGRRSFIASAVATGTAALAGCIDGGDGNDGSGADDDDEPDEGPDELDIGDRQLDPGFPLRIYEPNSDELVTEYQYHEGGSHWHFQPLEIPLEESRSMEVRFFDTDLNRVPVGPDEDYYLEVRPSEETSPDLLDIEVSGNLVTFSGSSSGTGEVVFELYRTEDDTLVWEPRSIEVTVG